MRVVLKGYPVSTSASGVLVFAVELVFEVVLPFAVELVFEVVLPFEVVMTSTSEVVMTSEEVLTHSPGRVLGGEGGVPHCTAAIKNREELNLCFSSDGREA